MFCTGATRRERIGALDKSLMTLGFVKLATLVKVVRKRGRVDDLFELLIGLLTSLEHLDLLKFEDGFVVGHTAQLERFMPVTLIGACPSTLDGSSIFECSTISYLHGRKSLNRSLMEFFVDWA